MNSFVVANPNKCIGCKSCEIACAVAHLGTSVATAGAMETPFQPRLALVKTPRVTMPVQCRQCEDAPCANVCPVQAISNEGGKIIVKTEICIGCKTCMLACPLGAMDMVVDSNEEEKKIAHKCDLCQGRPGGPACVEICLAQALVFVQPENIHNNILDRRTASATEIVRSRK